MTDDLALVARVDRLEVDPALTLASVDLTTADPRRLRTRFGEVFHYFAAVEGEVAQNALDVAALLPHLRDHDHRFLAVWSSHETAHSAIFDALRRELGLGPSCGDATPPEARRSFRTLGKLAEIEWVHDVLKLVYLTRGAMHEHLTLDAYTCLGAQLREMGEVALAVTVTDPIRRQEAQHLGYYRMAAALHRRRLSPTQLRLARSISVMTYEPVGALKRHRRAQCGRVFARLAGDDVERILDPIELIAGSLLGNKLGDVPRFVHRAMARCQREPKQWLRGRDRPSPSAGGNGPHLLSRHQARGAT